MVLEASALITEVSEANREDLMELVQETLSADSAEVDQRPVTPLPAVEEAGIPVEPVVLMLETVALQFVHQVVVEVPLIMELTR
jgi:hypothetical protein